MVCGLSQQAIGCGVAPERGRWGPPLNKNQISMVDFLGRLARSVVRLGPVSGCGARLPAARDHYGRLREQLEELVQLPYACSTRLFAQQSNSAFAATKALPVIADRLSLPAEVCDFNPAPFLSPLFRKIYEDPDAFLKEPQDMPDPVKIKGTATRSELLKVFQRWDHLHRLYVRKSSEVSEEDRCELFAVAKDVDKDRQILHRKRRNLREKHVPGASRDLPHGVLLCQLPLESSHVVACSVDDVKDFYHAYEATEARAKSSPVGPRFQFREVAHLNAYQAALAEGRIRPTDSLVCCFRGLGMGDHAAVDIAQESHVNVLRSFGGMRDSETLNYRKPLPLTQTGFYEGVMIDDHLGLQLLPRRNSRKRTLSQPGRDQEAFQEADKAYEAVGLQAHPKKKQRRTFHTQVLVAEIEGEQGLVGPSRGRLLQLARISAEVAVLGIGDEKIVEALTGLWAYCAQYRRPMFSFMHAVYHQRGPESGETLFKITRDARNEFMILAMLAPLCLNDLTVHPDPFLYCVDASPSGAGCCRVEVGENVSRQIWRRGDKLGYHRMPLLSRLGAALKGAGWDEDAVHDFLSEGEDPREDGGFPPISGLEASKDWIQLFLQKAVTQGWSPGFPQQLEEAGFDFLEMYSGRADMSRAWKEQGFRVLPPLDLRQGWDLRDAGLFWGILGLVARGRIKFVWWTPPCNTFSLARSPKVRSLKQPWGYDPMNWLTMLGNLHAAQSLLIALVQLLVGGFFGGAQPGFGFMRALDPWKFLTEVLGVPEFLFDWCRYGCPFKKTTRVMCNFPGINKLQRRCHHKKRHVPFRGPWTTTFGLGGYSSRFCRVVASHCWNEWPKGNCRNKSEVGNVTKFPPFLDRELPLKSRKPASPLWAVQLSESLCWKPFMQYSFKHLAHINLQETKARRSLVKRLKRDQRVVVFQDSRVNLGSLGKGRSPSTSLNGLMRQEAPYLLGKNLYLAGVHLPTWSIRADGPSRHRPVDPPRIAVPSWFWCLRKQPTPTTDFLADLEGRPRAHARWAVLVGRLLLAISGDCAPPFSWSSQQGPTVERTHHRKNKSVSARLAPQASSVADAAPWGVQSGHFGQEAHRHFVGILRRVYLAFVRVGTMQTGCSRDAECYSSDLWMAEAISCRALGADQILGTPGATYASSSHSSTSSACPCGLCSGLALAQAGGDVGAWLFCFVETSRMYWTAAARLGFTRRPSRRRCSLRAHRGPKDPVSHIPEPARPSGRTRLGALDCMDPTLHADVAAYLARLLVELFRTRYELLQKHVLHKVPFLPSSLRPGGATYLFRLFHEDLVKLQWRGRWRSFRLLEIYVQELGAAQVWIRFDSKTRQGVLFLGNCFLTVLHACRPVGLP